MFLIWLAAAALAGVTTWGSYHLKWLTAGGAMATFLMGFVLFGLGQFAFSLPVLIFFASSNFLSRFGRAIKSEVGTPAQKGSRRDAAQVLANGLLSTGLLIGWSLSRDSIWAVLFLIAVAGATADTWATEVGLLSKTPPRSILTFKRLTPGTSGAISWLGTVAAVAGALTIAVFGHLAFGVSPSIRLTFTHVGLITATGVTSQFLDSLLGACLQVQYRCSGCGCLTERSVHCKGAAISKSQGLEGVDNDVVNLASITGGVLVGWWALIVFF